jgi:hypothetical protein
MSMRETRLRRLGICYVEQEQEHRVSDFALGRWDGVVPLEPPLPVGTDNPVGIVSGCC